MATFTADKLSLTNLRGKNILITGGSSGIGLATAQLISAVSETNNIIVLDRTPPPESTSITAQPVSPATAQNQILRPPYFYQECDITSWVEQRRAFQAAVERYGSIDCVYVNAGIAEYKDQFFTDELDTDGQLKEPDRRTLEIDLNAACDTVKLALYWMRKAGKGGSIVMTASLAGYLASAGAPLYSAAKHGIVGLMRALKQDVATLNIAISVVAPAITITPILGQGAGRSEDIASWAATMAKRGVPLNKPESVALAVGYLMNKGIKANGQGLLVQADRFLDFEEGLAKSRRDWIGKEMLDLFRGGRDAGLFANSMKERQNAAKL